MCSHKGNSEGCDKIAQSKSKVKVISFDLRQ